jgi:xanthosine utilization system XapX-like protein
MEEIIIMIPLLVIIGFLGIVIGMYISSQIKCHIRRSIFNKNVKEYEQKEKTK